MLVAVVDEVVDVTDWVLLRVLSDDAVAGVVTVVSSVVKLVGRTGAAGVADVDVDDAGQLADPHSRLLGQQPPPSVAGQER